MSTEKQKAYQKSYRATHPVTQEQRDRKWANTLLRYKEYPELKAKHQEYDKLYKRSHPFTPEQFKRKKERERIRYLKITNHVKETVKNWRVKNKEKVKVYARRWRIKNYVRVKAGTDRWNKANHERRKATWRKTAAKIRSTIQGKIRSRMGTALWLALRDKKCGVHWEKLLGYTAKDLKKRLESQFDDGMNWNAYMRGEIVTHHIIPQFRFHYETTQDPEFKICWGLNNLTPMWRRDHFDLHKKVRKMRGLTPAPAAGVK